MTEPTEDDPEHETEMTTMIQTEGESTSDPNKSNGISSLPVAYINLLYVYAPSYTELD